MDKRTDTMAIAEFRDLSLDQLDDQLAKLKKEQFNLLSVGVRPE